MVSPAQSIEGDGDASCRGIARACCTVAVAAAAGLMGGVVAAAGGGGQTAGARRAELYAAGGSVRGTGVT